MKSYAHKRKDKKFWARFLSEWKLTLTHDFGCTTGWNNVKVLKAFNKLFHILWHKN